MNAPKMGRREALACGASWLGLLGLGVAVAKDEPEAYTPTGHLSAGDPVARNVAFVTLDGERVAGVFECDDVEGWVRHYVKGEDGRTVVVDKDTPGAQLRVARRTGVVRVHWRADV